MPSDAEILLAAKAIIDATREKAEEFTAQKMWKAGQEQDKPESAKWRALLAAIKKIRKLYEKAR